MFLYFYFVIFYLCLLCVLLTFLCVHFGFPSKSVVFFTSNGETFYRETDCLKFTKKRIEKKFNVTIVKARVFDSYADYRHHVSDYSSFGCFHDVVYKVINNE